MIYVVNLLVGHLHKKALSTTSSPMPVPEPPCAKRSSDKEIAEENPG